MKMINKIPRLCFLIIVLSFWGCSNDGKLTEYFDNGQLKKIAEINENGDLHGTVTEYHENGTVKSIGNWVDGIEDGEFKTFYNNGQLQAHYFMKDGLLSDCADHFTNEGNLLEKKCYQNGKKHGAFKRYDSGELINEDWFYEDTLYYSKLFINGKKVEVLRPIIYNIESNMSENEYVFGIKFGIEINGDYSFYVGSGIQNDQLVDTIQVLSSSNNYIGRVDPDELPESYIGILVNHDDKRDSLSANGLLINHKLKKNY